jgi:hypothetical protein
VLDSVETDSSNLDPMNQNISTCATSVRYLLNPVARALKLFPLIAIKPFALVETVYSSSSSSVELVGVVELASVNTNASRCEGSRRLTKS